MFRDLQAEKSVILKCGHEVYSGESVYTLSNRELCPECFERYIALLPTEYIAHLLGWQADTMR